MFVGADQFGSTVDELDAGVVHLAIPYDDRWSLSVDGESIPSRRAFGETTAFDVSTPGTGRLQYDSPATRLLLVVFQVGLWALALVVVSRVQVPTGRRGPLLADDEALIDLSSEPLVDTEHPVTAPPVVIAGAPGSATSAPADEVES